MNLEIDGLNIHYSVSGSGDYVFLLHGWGSNLELFSRLAEVIAKKHTVVSFDFPGFGRSDEPKSAWDVSAYAELTARFIETFRCQKVILLGHSFGGRVIIKMCGMTALPFSIEKIILVDSAGILPKRTLKHKLRLRAYKAGRGVLSLPPIKAIVPGALDSLRKKMGSSDYSSASETMRSILVRTVNEDLEPQLKNITAQTLLIWGENDTATPVEDGRKMEKAIAEAGTDAGLVVLKNAGHYSFLDQPHTFHRVVESFLKIGE